MSAPTQADLLTLSYAFLEGPHCALSAHATVDTRTLSYAFLQGPIYAPSAVLGGGPGGSQSQTYIINT